MQQLLAQARKVSEAAEVFSVTSEETQVQFEANRLKQLQTKQSSSIALRIIRQGRTGYATTTRLEDSQSLVTSAVETARFGMPAGFQFPADVPYPQVEVFDAAVPPAATEAMLRLGEQMIAAVTAHTPGIVCDAGINRGVISVSIINSRGGQASYRKSFFGLGIEGSLINDTDMLFVGESESSCHPLTDPAKVIASVLRQLDLAKRRATVSTRRMPVVFTPHGVASALATPLMAAFNGKTVLEGASPVGAKLGQAVFDSKLSLWDDPTIPFRPGSRPCDDEAVPSQRTPLIEQGRVTGFLYDLQTAARAGKRSTASGNRNGGGLPSPSPSAFVIAPGSTPFADMVRGIKEGLVIEQLMGASQGNVLGGDFSGNVLLGYKVENGEIAGRVKDTMVSGNIYQVLKEISVGDEPGWVGGFLHTPHIFCPSLSAASK